METKLVVGQRIEAGRGEDRDDLVVVRGTPEQIRYSTDASICIVWDTDADEAVRSPTQDDMDSLPVGADLTEDEIATLDE